MGNELTQRVNHGVLALFAHEKGEVMTQTDDAAEVTLYFKRYATVTAHTAGGRRGDSFITI